MNKGILGVVLAAAMIAFGTGCGGGGGTSSGGNGSTGTYTSVRVTGSLSGSSTQIDSNSVIEGDTVQFVLKGYDESFNWVTVPSSNWSTTAPGSVATISSSGLLHANAPSGSVYSVTGYYNGAAFTRNLTILARQAIVKGFVRNRNGAGIAGVYVIFYNSSGTEVGRTLTTSDGKFRVSVPATATQFTLDLNATDPTNKYYRQFSFGNDDYLASESSCNAPLPALSNGDTTTLSADIVVPDKASGQPPSPPTGCVG